MKKVLFVVALVMAVALYAGMAQAEPYVSGYAGIAIPHDSDSDGGKVGFDNGLALGLKGGYWFTDQNAPYFGLEADFMADFPNISEVKPPTIPADADVTNYAITANALLRYPEGDFKPYVGVGIGWYFMKVDDGTIGGTPFTGDNDNTFGWQLLAGVDWMVSQPVSVFVEYKYVLANFDFVFGGPGGGAGSIDYRASHVYGGVSYHF